MDVCLGITCFQGKHTMLIGVEQIVEFFRLKYYKPQTSSLLLPFMLNQTRVEFKPVFI